MSGEINGSGGEVTIHHVVDDPALDVSLMFVDQDFGAGVVSLDEAVLGFQRLVNLLVLTLVVVNPLHKVLDNLVGAV